MKKMQYFFFHLTYSSNDTSIKKGVLVFCTCNLAPEFHESIEDTKIEVKCRKKNHLPLRPYFS